MSEAVVAQRDGLGVAIVARALRGESRLLAFRRGGGAFLLPPAVPVPELESVVPPPQIFEEAPVLILVEALELLHAADAAADERLLRDHAAILRVLVGVRVHVVVVHPRAHLGFGRVEVVVGVDGQLHRRGEPAVGFGPRLARRAAERFLVVVLGRALHGTRPDVDPALLEVARRLQILGQINWRCLAPETA